ncbi:MAG: hydrogenase maturation protease, partial [Candidatus Margulisiibacteriota bacterium]
MQELKNKLKDANRVLVLGVGSDLRGDDAAGVIIAEEIEKKKIPNITTLLGGTAPENLTGEIKRLKPSHLIIIDAADLNEAPGTIKLIRMDQIGGLSFSTHALPMKMMVDFI